MTKYLFYCGKGRTEPAAVQQALSQCSDIILNFPSLVIELVEMVPNAAGYEAHIRVMALSEKVETKTKKIKSSQRTQASLQIKPNDDLGRLQGVEHETGALKEIQRKYTLDSFDVAVANGTLPDIPTQDFEEFKGLGLSVEEVRLYLDNREHNLRRKLEIDST